MEKYNKIKSTDKFSCLVNMFSNLDLLKMRGGNDSIISSIICDLEEFSGFEFMDAIRFRKELDIIGDYCEKFFDCDEKGFSYQIGCRYQHIEFDFTENIDAEINYLQGLLKIYNPIYIKEINLIKELICDLIKFKPKFDKYLNS